MKRIVIALACMVSVLLSLPCAAYADGAREMAVVSLPSFDVVTEYDSSEVDVVYSEHEGNNTSSALLYSKATGELLASYEEVPEIALSEVKSLQDNDASANSATSTQAAASNYNTTLRSTRTIASPNGKAVSVIVWAEVNVTAGASWGQIERVNAAGQNPASGSYTLQSPHTYSSTTSFPTNSVDINYQGTVQVTSSNSLGITYGGVQLAGFSLSGSVNSTWYARKWYQGSVTLNLR